MSRLVMGIALVLALSGAASARTLEVGPGKAYESLGAAERDLSNGDTIRLSAGEHFDCMSIRNSDITVEGSGKPEDTLITDKACAGKAGLVLDGNNITVRNLTLTRMRVPDGNGAGIRAEGGDLTVDHVRFVNNQDGILAASMPAATIIVRDSEFLQNGVCSPVCAHGIYVNSLKLLHVERTRFFETKQGHHIKSRAIRTEVIDSDLEDGPNGRSSYQIELPNGGALVVRGCTMEKGPLSDNHGTVISIGAEGVTQRTAEITVENNKFLLDGPWQPVFVRNLTATPAQLVGNTLAKGTIALDGDGTVR